MSSSSRKCVPCGKSDDDWQEAAAARLPFLFAITCRCKENGVFQRSLVWTSCTFALPACLLLMQGTVVIGAGTALLTATSVVYHWGHAPAARAVDVLTLYMLCPMACVQAFIGLGRTGPWNPWLWTVPLGSLAVSCIAVVPQCSRPLPITKHAGGTQLFQIQLQWHMALHAICTVALTCLAVGLAE